METVDDLNHGVLGVKRYRQMRPEIDVVRMHHSESCGGVGITVWPHGRVSLGEY